MGIKRKKKDGSRIVWEIVEQKKKIGEDSGQIVESSALRFV